MDIKEQRREPRFLLTHKPKGMLFLHVHGECLPVHSIRDISQTGVSLLFDYEVNQGDHVDLEYKDRGKEVKVSGIVAWQSQPGSQTSEAKHLLGVSMFNPNMLLSFMQIS